MSFNITRKPCTICGEIKLISEFYKHKNKALRNGYAYRSECKECSNKTCQSYNKINKDKLDRRNKEYYQENNERIKQKTREYKLLNKDKIKHYPSREKDYVSSYNAKYSADHRKELTKKKREYRVKNPEKLAQFNRNRKAYKRGGQGDITDKEWKELLVKYNYTCLRCRKTDVKLTLDHVLPLCKGGENTIENAQPLCLSCNCKKGTKHIDYRPAFLEAVVVNGCSKA